MSDLSYDDDEPVTGILEVPRGMRPWAESQSRKTRRLERMIQSVDKKIDLFLAKRDTERGMIGKLPTVLAVIALLVAWAGGAIALYVHAQATSAPNAEDIAKQIVKLQQQH